MKVIFVKDYDQVNYRKPCMFIGLPYCSFKCDIENGNQYCQNRYLSSTSVVDISNENLIKSYIDFSLTKSIVFGGLEPFDSFDEVLSFVDDFRKISEDDIVIYTGYYRTEIEYKISQLKSYKNIIIKFGRFKPNQKRHYDETLGVYLASDNQYAERIS